MAQDKQEVCPVIYWKAPRSHGRQAEALVWGW